MLQERVLLGIDPGTSQMGYGVIRQTRRQLSAVHYGVLSLQRVATLTLKLQQIFDHVRALIADFHPSAVVLEAPFYGKNAQVMLKLGRAQGMAIAAALAQRIPIAEYAPRKIKQAVTGNGNASKEQVARMLVALLKLPTLPHALDASDALAVAVCHAYQKA